MKAITQNTYGSPDAMQLVDVERPTVGAGDVLVEVHASIVSQGDRRISTGDFPGITAPLGRLAIGVTGPRHRVTGTMFAGRVVEVGADVTRFAVGDDVFGSGLHGAYAELMAVSQDSPVSKMPAGLTYEEAAAIPYGGITARTFLRDMAQLKPGEHVCIVGASGGVGRYAVQLAHHLGAEVTAVCSRRNHDRVRLLGADHVVDYASDDFTALGHRYDVVFDTVGASSFSHSRAALAEGGRYLSLLVTVGLLAQVLLTRLFGSRRAFAGAAMGTAAEMDEVAELVGKGALRASVDRVFPLAETADAHRYVASGQAIGDVVVSVVAPERAAAVA